tara:strand:+ start:2983 stop:3480 length:498 start_codon:yes stop_codon:yes gene_type:complete
MQQELAEKQALLAELQQEAADRNAATGNDPASVAAAAEDAAAEAMKKLVDGQADTKAASTTTLDEKLNEMGGSSAAISTIQNSVYQELTAAQKKEQLEIKKRKKQQLEQAVRQRKRSGFTGRKSLITGQSGGRGFLYKGQTNFNTAANKKTSDALMTKLIKESKQ